MTAQRPDYAIFDALHDGTIAGFDRQDDGSLLMRVDIEYLADRLEAGSTIIRTRFVGDSDPTAAFESWSAEGDDSFPKDLLEEQDLDITFLSVSDEAVAAGEDVDVYRVEIHCVGGTLRLSFGTFFFETESGIAITTETLEWASGQYWGSWSARGLAGKLDLHMRSATPTDMPVLRDLYSELLGVRATFSPRVDPANELQSDWVKKPGELFTWLFHRRGEDGRLHPVGMALVCGEAYTEAIGGRGDFWLSEFVITEKERRKGVGRAGLALVMDAHEGEWGLDVSPSNEPAVAFWTSALAHYQPRTHLHTDDNGVEFMRFEYGTRVPLS